MACPLLRSDGGCCILGRHIAYRPVKTRVGCNQHNHLEATMFASTVGREQRLIFVPFQGKVLLFSLRIVEFCWYTHTPVALALAMPTFCFAHFALPFCCYTNFVIFFFYFLFLVCEALLQLQPDANVFLCT